MGTSSSKELQEGNATTGAASNTLSDIGGGGSVVPGSPSTGAPVNGHRRQGSFAKQDKQQKKKKSQRQSSSSSTSNSSSTNTSRRPSTSFDKSQSHSSSSLGDINLDCNSSELDNPDNSNGNNNILASPTSSAAVNSISSSNSQSQLHLHSLSNQDYASNSSSSLINTPNDSQTPRSPNLHQKDGNNNQDILSSSISSTSNSLSSMIIHNDSSSSLRDHQLLICEHCHQVSTSRPSSAFRPSSSMSNPIDFGVNTRGRTNSTFRTNNLTNSIYNPTNLVSSSSSTNTNNHFNNNNVNSSSNYGYDDDMRNINLLTISNNSISQYNNIDETRVLSPPPNNNNIIQQQQQSIQSNDNNNHNAQSLNHSFSNFNNLPFPNSNNNISLSISSPSIITPTTNRLSGGMQSSAFLPTSAFNISGSSSSANQSQDLQSNTSILNSSIGSTSELFNKSLINSFLSSTNQQQQQLQLQQLQQQQAANHQQQISTHQLQQHSQQMYNSISPPVTPRHHPPRDLSYDTKDTFTITVSNSELNSMISDNSIGSIGSGFQRLTVSSSSHRSGGIKNNDHNMHNNTSSGSNDSLFGAQKKEAVSDYSKDITFLHSDHDSVKEKSNLSTASFSSHNRNHLTSSLQRPRGRSISDSYLSSNGLSTKDCINDFQKALDNEKINNNRFNALKEILNVRNDIIIEINDIQFVQKVGEGAFSEVWEGWWKGIHVAVKKLKIIGDEEQFQERFLREVENLKRGNHQNIVMFMGACYKPACIITEYMSGGSLYNVLHNPNTPKVKYSFPLVLRMATDIALGLAHLHSLNIVHRDLTSQNILLDEVGNLKISDFGLSREKPRDGSMTMTNGGICNPRWRPPEITKNLGHYSEKMDVYCFSLVVWELLVGEIPFSDLDGSQASAQVAYAGLRPTIPEHCDRNLAELLVQCWDTDPAKRPLFPYIVAKLREINWSNPIGFLSEKDSSESSTPRSLSPIKSGKIPYNN